MSEALDNALAKIDAMETSITGIEGDITFIKSQLPTEGGMSAEDVAVLNTRLDSVLNRVKGIDEQTPPPSPIEG